MRSLPRTGFWLCLALVALAVLPSAASAVTVSVRADFNGDGFSDLAVGAQGESISSQGQVGAVNVLYGSATGLTSTGARQLLQSDAGGAVEAGDVFGATLAAGDF